MNTLEILKLQLNDFFDNSKQQTISRTINKEEYQFNKSLFELEKHLYKLKKDYNVNQNLNPGIKSENILKSFNANTTFFRSNDYALSFLVYLTIQGNHNAEDLLSIMNQYIEIINEKLTFHDIVTTDTGATRCYTNLRFALNELRNYGLVYSNIRLPQRNFRSILPTPVGYLISLMVSEPNQFDVLEHLPNHCNSANRFVAPLYKALTSIKNDPEKILTCLLEKYKGIKDLEDSLHRILNNYSESVLQFIELTDNGWRVDEKELEKSIKTYYLRIAVDYNVAVSLKNVLSNLITPKPQLGLF